MNQQDIFYVKGFLKLCVYHFVFVYMFMFFCVCVIISAWIVYAHVHSSCYSFEGLFLRLSGFSLQ